MLFLLIAIACSVAVSVFLKLARRQSIDIRQAIAFNYLTALLLTFTLLKPDLSAEHVQVAMNQGAGVLLLALGILLPSVFLVLFRAVECAGIVRTDAAQRLSLFLPIIAAFTLFGETVLMTRIFSLVLAFAALFCLLWKPDPNNHTTKSAVILLVVWFGFGIIDILLKQISKLGQALPLTLFVIFAIAACVMFAYLQGRQLLTGMRWQGKSMLSGLLLGGLNFMNIYFYLLAHRTFSQNPTLVFAGMNVGVICLGSLIGLWVFKEKMSRINFAGVGLGIVAILCLFYLDSWVA
ncbi:EamA/RhaT family transporter [Pasteurellaceae bacterium HPA106]|uniref:EamA/RhaT family transporter n=1 Tax=Spirabiliibacterium pneumoniae TaxID=221400 RepID=UPI001AACF0FD|nr:EamA/RhaT family transporter [Spirabiliibacterium pneumoniae]MBE2896495.1 EamA/RhaT family transporter [Spirabiliibacterium pneumoniae]